MISRICNIKGKTVHPFIFHVRKIKCSHSCSSRSLFCKDEQNCVFSPTDNLTHGISSIWFQNRNPTHLGHQESHLLLKIIPKEKVCEVIYFNWDNYDNKVLNTVSQRKYNRTWERTIKRNYKLLSHEKKNA